MGRRTKKVYAAGMAIEDTYNVYKAPTTYMRYLKLGLKVDPNDEELNISDGTPGSTYVYRKDAEIGGPMEIPAWPEESLEPLLKLIFGSAVSTRNIPSNGISYTHEFTQSWTNILSASITRWIPGNSGAEEVEAFTGAVLDSLEIGFDGPGPISLKPTWSCGGYDASKSAPTRTYSTAPIFVWGNFTCKVDQTLKTDVTKGTLKIERALDKLTGASGNPVTALLPNILTPTDWKVTGSLQFPVENREWLLEYISGSTTGTTLDTIIADKELELICTGETIESTYKYLMHFKMPQVNMTKCDNDKDAEKTEMYDIDYRARRYTGADNGLGTNKILSATVVSKLAAIT
jgi:hypothetical protein